MITIKFAHFYKKMPLNTDITLLENIKVVNLEDLSEKFLKYDTEIVGGGYFPLPKRGKYLLITLLTGDWKWTTLRRWSIEKEQYYRSHIGEYVNIKIKVGDE